MKNAAVYIFSNKFRVLHSGFCFGLFAYKKLNYLFRFNGLLTNFVTSGNFAILILLSYMLVFLVCNLHFIKGWFMV